MKQMTDDELKALQLDILEHFHKFCVGNNLCYSLAYGTLIGAIRHKGYIPWDDDIDVVMPRPDYDIFVNSFNKEKDFLKVFSPELDLDYYSPYANLIDLRTLLVEEKISHRGMKLGVKIDIFPLDGVPEDEESYRQHTKRILKYNEILRYKKVKFSNIHTWKGRFYFLYRNLKLAIHPYKNTQKKLLALLRQYPYTTSKYIENSVFPVYPYTRCPKEVFDSTIDVEFEGRQFKAFKGYDQYLKTIYGDYMQLPPVEKRIGHHGFVAYWK